MRFTLFVGLTVMWRVTVEEKCGEVERRTSNSNTNSSKGEPFPSLVPAPECIAAGVSPPEYRRKKRKRREYGRVKRREVR